MNIKKILQSIIKFFLKIVKNTIYFIGSAILGLIILGVILARILGDINTTQHNSRVVIQGGNQEIAYVKLSGEIVYSSETGLLGVQSNLISPDQTKQLFKYLGEQNHITAVVLNINSPGGSVSASEEIYQQLLQLSLNKPIFVYFGELAASGGYYIALPAKQIYASTPTITGSIGVVAFDPDLSGLYEKLGIQIQTYQSGPLKDMGSMDRPATQQEAEIFASIIDDSYQLFIDRIEHHRSLTRQEIQTLADGRIYSGKQAAENGLIDGLGTLETVFQIASSYSQLENPTIKEYFVSSSPLSSLLGVSRSKLPLGLFEVPTQAKLGLYYLWVR